MHKLYVRFSGLFILAITAIACSNSPSAPTRATSSGLVSAQLAGTWTLTSIQPDGQSPQVRPAGADYSITFEDGRLSTRTDCNVCSGGFAITGATLTAGPLLACTRAMCPTASFEYAYTTLLSGESAIQSSANSLTLSSARGSIQFVR
jgi:heat shock protein HslJ